MDSGYPPSLSADELSHGLTCQKGLIYLNNAACLLLENGAYEEAMDTISDAIGVMKNIVNTSHSQIKSKYQEIDLDTRLKQAASRMASPHQRIFCDARSQHTKSDSSVMHCSSSNVVTISLSDYRMCEIEDMIMIAPSEQILICPIRIDIDDDLSSNSDMLAAILLYNLGVTYSAKARSSYCESLSEQHHLQDVAIKIFLVVNSVLLKQANHPFNHHTQNRRTSLVDRFEAITLACIHMALMHSIIQLKTLEHRQQSKLHPYLTGDHMELDDRTVEYCYEWLERWDCLRQCLFLLDQMTPFALEENIAAAAA
jgi:hypothetical protein